MSSPVKLPDFTAQSLTRTRHFTCAAFKGGRTWCRPDRSYQVVVGEVVRRKSESVAELHSVVAQNTFCVAVQKRKAAAQISGGH